MNSATIKEIIMGQGQRLIPIISAWKQRPHEVKQNEHTNVSEYVLEGVVSRADLIHIMMNEPSRFPVQQDKIKVYVSAFEY